MRLIIRNYIHFFLFLYPSCVVEKIVVGCYREYERKNGPLFTGSRFAVHYRLKVRKSFNRFECHVNLANLKFIVKNY